MSAKPTLLVWILLATVLSPYQGGTAVTVDPTVIPLLKRSFFHGREYFVLRSGRAKMVVQADQADLAPAFLYLLFDAEDNRQTSRKERAFNFEEGAGFVRSALEVKLGGFNFSALGHKTATRWVQMDGIPAVEAVWWAGGLKVTERIAALAGANAFLRRVELSSVNLGGTESVTLSLSTPRLSAKAQGNMLVDETPARRLALAPPSSIPAKPLQDAGALEIGPITLVPGQRVSVETVLMVQIPSGPLLVPPQLPKLLSTTRASHVAVSTITTQDATVREIFAKSTYGLPGMVAENGVMDAGIFEYGAQWVRDTSNTLLGMIHAGYFELARNGLDYVIRNMVSAEGNAMIAGAFDDPDREQFDQMGELLHTLKAYRDWTGDDSLIRRHRDKLVALVERPLKPQFRDACGMVHNRREFWERTLEDAFELAYQTYVILGLRDAASLADPLGVPEKAALWRHEADRILRAMCSDPRFRLVEEGRLIKRRGVNGEWVKQIRFPGAAEDVPLRTERTNLAEPDATLAMPIAFRLIDPASPLAAKTLDELERLRDARWTGGGYERYHSSGQCDQPGPWTFATCFILRAQHEAAQWSRSRSSLEWLNTTQGGRTGAWFEEIPQVRSQAPTAGLLPWTSGEISLFAVRHLLGVSFEGDRLVLRPALYPGSPPLEANLRFRSGRLELQIPNSGTVVSAKVNGQRIKADASASIRLPQDFQGGRVVFETRKPKRTR